MEYQVAIIGAGVVGAMAARELSRYRLKICLLEAENDVAMGASKANSGIIHAGYDPEPGTLKARFNREGNPLLYEAARQLRVPHRNNGAFVCAFSPEEETQLEALYRRGRENRIPGLSLLSGEEARALEPGLSPMVTRVLLAATSGIICPYELTIAAVGNAMDNGVALYRNFRVSEIQKKDNGFVLRSSHGESVQAQWVVNCAGVHAGEIGRLAGDPLPEILPGQGGVLVLEKVHAPAIVVEHLGEGRLKAGLMGAALGGGDVVDIGKDALAVAVVVLHGDIHLNAVLCPLDVDGIGIYRGLVPVQVADKIR